MPRRRATGSEQGEQQDEQRSFHGAETYAAGRADMAAVRLTETNSARDVALFSWAFCAHQAKNSSGTIWHSIARTPERWNPLRAATAIASHFLNESSKHSGSVALAFTCAQVCSVYQVTPMMSA